MPVRRILKHSQAGSSFENCLCESEELTGDDPSLKYSVGVVIQFLKKERRCKNLRIGCFSLQGKALGIFLAVPGHSVAGTDMD